MATLQEHMQKFSKAVELCESGKPSVYLYGSKALKRRMESFLSEKKHTAVPLSNDYEPNPWVYQYDLEVYIFLHHKDIAKEELEMAPDGEGFPTDRHFHLLNAMKIRWPSKRQEDGSLKGEFVINPWVVTKAKTVSIWTNTLVMGGAGQGKTLFFIAFLCIIFDHFIWTKRGAHCAFSTISKSKMTGTTWSHVTKLYPVETSRKRFSLYAGLGVESTDFQYKRVDPDTGKRLERGRIVGVLLSQGRKDSTQIDKLTGLHDAEAKVYLLDEAQSTDSSPIDAYTNMFLHPKHGWFFMLGNYSKDNDLLGINAEPDKGWNSVNEKTHTWMGRLKSHTSNLDLPICVIHLNNELSPAIVTDKVRYRLCCPTEAKRNEQYPSEESKKSEAYKRFWIGFRYSSIMNNGNIVIPYSHITNFVRAYERYPHEPIKMWSFDSAPASVDRNVLTLASMFESGGKPVIQFDRFIPLPKPSNPLKYYKETADAIEGHIKNFGIQTGQGSKPRGIQDFSQRTQLVEELMSRGIGCYAMTYGESVPSVRGPNKITGVYESPVELEVVNRFAGNLERSFMIYAHQRVRSRIALGAYLFALFLEKGCIAGINQNSIAEASSIGLEKEICLRAFTSVKSPAYGDLFTLERKEDFKSEHRFSPDIFDTICQMFYMIYVEMGVRTNTSNLDFLRSAENRNNYLDNVKNTWHGGGFARNNNTRGRLIIR
jgi:hypothetical protein